MVWEAIFWSMVTFFLAVIAVVAFASHAKPIGYLFVLLTVLSLAYLVVRWREFRKGKLPEEAPTTEPSTQES